MELEFGTIESAAKQALFDLNRASFSSEGFSTEEIDAIATAIVAAIKAYDEQKSH